MRYPHEYDWVKGELLCSMVGTGMQLYRHVRSRYRHGVAAGRDSGNGGSENMNAGNSGAEMVGGDRMMQKLKSDYTTLMKRLASTDWTPIERIKLKVSHGSRPADQKNVR